MWRVPYPIRPDCPSAFSPLRFLARTSSRLSSAHSLSFSSQTYSSSFLPFHVPLPRSPLSFLRFPRRERERDVRRDAYAHVSFLLVRRECLRWSLDPGSSTRTHCRDDDVRDITPAGERGSPKVRRGGSAGERRGEKERKVR